MDDNGAASVDEISLGDLGERVSWQRRARSWTLETLSARAGISQGFLSRLESGGRQPSLSSLIRIASAMEITVSSLLGESLDLEPEAEADTREVYGTDGFQYEQLTSPKSHQLSILKLTIRPNRQDERLHSHPGVEWIYVLEGQLGVTVGDDRWLIDQGKSIEFEARLGHRFDCPGDDDTSALLIVTPEYSPSHTPLPAGGALVSFKPEEMR